MDKVLERKEHDQMAIKTTTKATQRETQSTNTRHGGGNAVRPYDRRGVFLRKIMTTKLKEINMRVYVNGIDCGDGRVDKRETALGMIKVMYHEAMFPTYYPKDKCIFTTRFGKKCMIYGGDYSEEDIININKQYIEHLERR